MREQLHTIPVNEAFDLREGCPLCTIYKKLENNELNIILGASMMEPDIRIKTNKSGFCRNHYKKMFNAKNRLSLALMLESHLNEIIANMYTGAVFKRPDSKKHGEFLSELENSCYICSRIDVYMQQMLFTVFYLWRGEDDFKKKFREQKYFCLPHYRSLIESAAKELSKQELNTFRDILNEIQNAFLKKLSGDVTWFCEKFDYRNADADWKDSRDAVERAIYIISGESPDT